MRVPALAALVALAASPAASPAAAADRDLCPNRPGLGTPPCTVEPGRVVVETGLVDWTRDDDGGTRTDTVLAADTLARIGVADAVEVQLGWTPFGHQRERSGGGPATTAGRVGDAVLGLKANLHNPDGSGFSAAVQGEVSVPVGRTPIGAGDWGVATMIPLAYELRKGLTLQATPELDAAVDEDGHGRHAAWGGTLGLGIDVTDAVTLTAEGQALRDLDPAGHVTRLLAGLSVAWQPADDLQLDGGVNSGLNRASDDLELYAGITRRF